MTFKRLYFVLPFTSLDHVAIVSITSLNSELLGFANTYKHLGITNIFFVNQDYIFSKRSDVSQMCP